MMSIQHKNVKECYERKNRCSSLSNFEDINGLYLSSLGLIAIGTLSYTPSQSAQAAETVIIVSQTVYCDRIDVTYQVIAAFQTDYAIITAHSGNTQLGSVNGTGTPSGTYLATVSVSPAQPAGTMLRVEIEINDGNGYYVDRIGTAVSCYDDSNPGSGGVTIPPPSDTNNSPPPWNGFTDGRLSPHMAEYYTVYCHDDLIYVHRANPPPTVTLTEIPIVRVAQPYAGSFNQDGITVSYNGQDEITLYGSNGNLAPASGSKTFSLNACIESNGGEFPGYDPTDGRIDPDASEHYAVYCHDDLIYVHRTNPPPTVTVTEIPIAQITRLSPYGGLYNHDGIQVHRNFGDDIRLNGLNDNGDGIGSITFSLNACIESNGGEFPGYNPTDGRIDPDPSEHYAIYCHNDLIYVHRTNPPPTVTVTEIPIVRATQLDSERGIGQKYYFDHDDLYVERRDDQITLRGPNGNLDSEYGGSKTFSLNACIESNGGVPENTPPILIYEGGRLHDREFEAEDDAEDGTVTTIVGDWGYGFILRFKVDDVDYDTLTIGARSHNDNIVAIGNVRPSEDDGDDLRDYEQVVVELTSRNSGETNVTITVSDGHGGITEKTIPIVVHDENLRGIFEALTDCISALGLAIGAPAIGFVYSMQSYRKKNKKSFE